LGAGAAALTALAVYMTVKNRQRSLWLQALSAAGLSSSGVATCLAVTGTIPAWAWWWCGLHCAHFLASILVVHARLEARIAARKGAEVLTAGFLALRRQAVAVEIILISTAVWLLISGQIFYAAALLLSEGMHAYDLARLHTASAIAMPMTRVGLRALAVSIAFTGLAIAGALTA